jgi:hypothetical protein
MGQRQFATPLIIRGESVVTLEPLKGSFESERKLQKLLFSQPSLIPLDEIEPGFGKLFSLAMEVSTSRGSIDLLYVSESGNLVLVETKLWRNPEAGRTVVGQILDYASDLSRWSYAQLNQKINNALRETLADPLLAARQRGIDGPFDASDFRNKVSRNIENSRFLLLIIGDSIHDSVGEMAEFLQRSPQSGFRIGLVEIALFQSPAGGDIFVQPRVVALTREVTRAVVEVHVLAGAPGVKVEVRPPEPEVSKMEGASGRSSLLQEEFYEDLRRSDPSLVGAVTATVEEAKAHKLDVEWRSNGPILKYWFEDEEFFNFGQIARDGTLAYTGWLREKCIRLELPRDVWEPYYKAMASLFGLSISVKKRDKASEGEEWCLMDGAGEDPPAAPILARRQEWFRLIDETIERIDRRMGEAR